MYKSLSSWSISLVYTSNLNWFQSGFKSVQGSCVNAPNSLWKLLSVSHVHNGCGLAKPVPGSRYRLDQHKNLYPYIIIQRTLSHIVKEPTVKNRGFFSGFDLFGPTVHDELPVSHHTPNSISHHGPSHKIAQISL